MDRIAMTCCFTGHRTAKLPWKNDREDGRCISLTEELYRKSEELYQTGYRNFICGMALGCDTYFAETILKLKSVYPDISLEAAVPCRSQANHWTKVQKEEYFRLLDRCDKVTVLQEGYSRGCMMARNRYMVDHSSLLLACYNGIQGGTLNTILYARRQGLPVIIMDLSEFTDLEVCTDEE